MGLLTPSVLRFYWIDISFFRILETAAENFCFLKIFSSFLIERMDSFMENTLWNLFKSF